MRYQQLYLFFLFNLLASSGLAAPVSGDSNTPSVELSIQRSVGFNNGRIKKPWKFSPRPKLRARANAGTRIFFTLGIMLFLGGVFMLLDFFGDQFFDIWGLWIGIGSILLAGLCFVLAFA